MTSRLLGWLGIVRLGLVQTALGAIVVLATSTLNRVMVVEYQLAAAIPAGLVAWHYAVQLSRPLWGHASDAGGRRTPWIIVGMGVLALGALAATDATLVLAGSPIWGTLLGVAGFALIGAGVGAAGTSLLALLAARVAPERRPAAAAITWIMMIIGLAGTAGVVGALLDPFSPQRLILVVSLVAGMAFLVACAAVFRVEGGAATPRLAGEVKPPLRAMIGEVWADPRGRGFALFVLLSMLAYSMQDLILEPFAGLRFGFSPGQSTSLSGAQHGGVLVGMLLVGAIGARFNGHKAAWMRGWTAGGCLGSAVALAGLALAARIGPGWPLTLNVVLLGFCNGVFAVAAIGSMMGLASAGESGREGSRLGVWGAAQALGFGLGGLIGAGAADMLRALTGSDPLAFSLVFAAEAGLFLVAAWSAWRLADVAAAGERRLPALPTEPIEPAHSF